VMIIIVIVTKTVSFAIGTQNDDMDNRMTGKVTEMTILMMTKMNATEGRQ
jgi:hypothetical protein